jgi:hypothetical protein
MKLKTLVILLNGLWAVSRNSFFNDFTETFDFERISDFEESSGNGSGDLDGGPESSTTTSTNIEEPTESWLTGIH